MDKKYTLSEAVINGIMQLINSRPYGEVVQLASAMANELQNQTENVKVLDPPADMDDTEKEN